MEKRDDQERHIAELVEDLISDVGDDRQRLTAFLDDLMASYKGEGTVAIAEYVAKLVDAATRQHQVKVGIVKALAKAIPEGSDERDEIAGEIGLPFKDEVIGDGSN